MKLRIIEHLFLFLYYEKETGKWLFKDEDYVTGSSIRYMEHNITDFPSNALCLK